MSEIWRDIAEYKGLYEVSNIGRVRSLNYGGTGKIVVLTLSRTNNGYLCCNLSGKTHFVHRLVAAAFLPRDLSRPHIDHIDGDRQNNCIENLRWCTAKENHNFPLAIQRNRDAQHSKPVLQYSRNMVLMAEWQSARAAERALGIAHTHIVDCCKRKPRHITAGGFIWRYKSQNPGIH